jgi:disulfide bond formation protein DsbB
MKLPSLRQVNLLAFLVCSASILFALWLEVYMKLLPCPLCVIQRVIIIVLGLLFLGGALPKFQSKISQRVYHLIIFLMAALGICVATRHVFLELFPPVQAPSCGAGLGYMLQILPPIQVLQLVLQGTAECTKVAGRFLGLSIPAWTLLFFIFLAGLALWQSFRKDE